MKAGLNNTVNKTHIYFNDHDFIHSCLGTISLRMVRSDEKGSVFACKDILKQLCMTKVYMYTVMTARSLIIQQNIQSMFSNSLIIHKENTKEINVQ